MRNEFLDDLDGGGPELAGMLFFKNQESLIRLAKRFDLKIALYLYEKDAIAQIITSETLPAELCLEFKAMLRMFDDGRAYLAQRVYEETYQSSTPTAREQE